MISELIGYVKSMFASEKKEDIEENSRQQEEHAEKIVLKNKKKKTEFVTGKTQSMIDNQALTGYLDMSGKVNNAGHEKLQAHRSHTHRHQ